jgi:hypothetical protein
MISRSRFPCKLCHVYPWIVWVFFCAKSPVSLRVPCLGQGCEPVFFIPTPAQPLANLLLGPLATFVDDHHHVTDSCPHTHHGPNSPKLWPQSTDSPGQIWHPQNAQTSDASVGAFVGKTLGQGVCELQQQQTGHHHPPTRPALSISMGVCTSVKVKGRYMKILYHSHSGSRWWITLAAAPACSFLTSLDACPVQPTATVYPQLPPSNSFVTRHSAAIAHHSGY